MIYVVDIAYASYCDIFDVHVLSVAIGMQKQECKKVPVTCRIVSDFPPASGCRRGQVKFSLMEPGTHVWPHCGPTNCRLRAHLGLVVPDNVTIRVAEEVR